MNDVSSKGNGRGEPNPPEIKQRHTSASDSPIGVTFCLFQNKPKSGIQLRSTLASTGTPVTARAQPWLSAG